MLFLLGKDRKTEHNTHFCMPLKPVFTKGCGNGVHFIDEPTIGLDAVSKLAVRKFIRELNAARGTTIVLTTHDMQDIEALTERILLIGRGRILLDGKLSDVKKQVSERKTMVITYQGEPPALQKEMKLVESGKGRMTVSFERRCFRCPGQSRILP